MGKKEVAADVLAGVLKLSRWGATKAFQGAVRGCEYLHDHRDDIKDAVKLGTIATGHAAKSFGSTLYDAASLKIYPKEDIERFRKRLKNRDASTDNSPARS